MFLQSLYRLYSVNKVLEPATFDQTYVFVYLFHLIDTVFVIEFFEEAGGESDFAQTNHNSRRVYTDFQVKVSTNLVHLFVTLETDLSGKGNVFGA